jgi:hypothetical protein
MKILKDKKFDGLRNIDRARSDQKKTTIDKKEDLVQIEEEKKEDFLGTDSTQQQMARPRALSFSQKKNIKNEDPNNNNAENNTQQVGEINNELHFSALLSPTPEKRASDNNNHNTHDHGIEVAEGTLIREDLGTTGGGDPHNKFSSSTGSNHDEQRSDDDTDEHVPITGSKAGGITQSTVLLKRAISQPDITKLAEEKPEEKMETMKNNSKTKKKKEVQHKNDHYYDLFFHYFESFLEKHLLNKYGPKQSQQMSPVGNRPHSYSVANI